MTPEIRRRYEDALDTLRGIVADTGDARDRVQALLRATAFKIMEALEAGEDTDSIIEDFRAQAENIVIENMQKAAEAAQDEDDKSSLPIVSLSLTLDRTDVATPIEHYSNALSQEVAWFVAGGFAYSALRDYLKDPLGFLASESMKPAPKGQAKRQTDGRMTLAPVFMDGKRRRSLSEVLADFRRSITSVGSGNSYQVGRSIWTILNVTSMRAYEDALVMKWAGKGAIGYYVFRASTYDCPTCDELCGYLHPLTDMVVPAHPNCVCITVEAYQGEDDADFEI